MGRLVVEVLEANDLMPKDGQGSASPFVEIDIDDQNQRTKTKVKDLNPSWNEKLVFKIDDMQDLSRKTIVVVIYNENTSHGNHNFLGRVRLSGLSVPRSESEAMVQRYPLEKRGIFSHIRGDIALRLYLADGRDEDEASSDQPESPKEKTKKGAESRETPVHENVKKFDKKVQDDQFTDFTRQKIKKKKEKEIRTFYSVGTGGSTGPMQKPVVFETRPQFIPPRAAPGPPMVMQTQFPMQKPEFGLVETRPPVAARMGYLGGDKMASTYDLVEQVHYLYVNVVKARDLPATDITGSLDPYVEVKVGNYRGLTKHLEHNQDPTWNSVFAFSKERLQSNLVEVIVRAKDLGKDDFVGKVVFDVVEVPLRVPPDSPLAPQWYRLAGKGEIMLAVWLGTQADEAFPEAWHSDAHDINHHNLASTRSKVYFSPKLYYLRVHVIEAQDLVPSDKTRLPQPYVRIQLGHQIRVTRPSQTRNINAAWNEELMLVASEPFDDFLIVSVEDRGEGGREDNMGRTMIPVREIPPRVDSSKLPDPRWLNLQKPSHSVHEDGEKEVKFSSKIRLCLCLDVGYHVLDETTHFSSDFQPSSKYLRKPRIGILEVGILSAQNLLPMKSREGGSTDAYCVAKYGNKWVRTRTLLNTLSPKWNEQYTWEVYDPCTVITIGVFDNFHVNGNKEDARDQKIGKVRIRLSTLEIDRIYTHNYPLLVLQPSGLKKHGELHLAIRFTCVAWVNMLTQYSKPLLPKMHYVQPISVRHIDWLRHQAMQIVAARLSRAEPPLRRETVEYMLDVDYHMWSLRRSKANFYRIISLLSGVSAIWKWLDGICNWRNPLTTCLVHVLFLILVCYPELILPTIFLYLCVIGLWNFQFRPRKPPHMDARISQAENVHPDELDEEFDTFPSSRPVDLIRMRYDRMRSVAGRVQTVLGDLATQSERALAILSWRDSRATAIFIIFALMWATLFYLTPFQVIAALHGLYWLRHPKFRNKMPSVPVNFFKRLPSKSDMLIS